MQLLTTVLAVRMGSKVVNSCLILGLTECSFLSYRRFRLRHVSHRLCRGGIFTFCLGFIYLECHGTSLLFFPRRGCAPCLLGFGCFKLCATSGVRYSRKKTGVNNFIMPFIICFFSGKKNTQLLTRFISVRFGLTDYRRNLYKSRVPCIFFCM